MEAPEDVEAAHRDLRRDAWFPHTLLALLQSVARHVDTSAGGSGCATAIFPECGSGYFEWHVVRLLRAAPRHVALSEVVMMDARTEPRWLDAWATLAASNGVRLVALDSYEQLWAWAEARDADTAAASSLVIYINACLRFSPSTCSPPLSCEGSRAAAVRFWQWCAAHAANPPANFLHGAPRPPCSCTTWLALAEVHSRPIEGP